MRYAILIGLSWVWAQYRLQGRITQPARDTLLPVEVELDLFPQGLRYNLKGTHREKTYHIALFFTQKGVYLLDHLQKKAYAIEVSKQTPLLLERAELQDTFHTPYGKAEKWFLFYPKLRIEVAWIKEVAFDWKPWEAYLEPDRIGAVARYFRQGIPLEIIQYEEDQKTWQLVIETVKRLPDDTFQEKIPYPLEKWPKE